MLWKFKMLFKKIFVKLFSKRVRLINDELYSKIIYLITFLKRGNFKEPKTFNEHLCALKLRDEELFYDKYTDKFEAREYVSHTVGEEILNEVYGAYKSFDEIDFDKLPDKFALKGTHGSGFNMIVKDKKNLDRARAKALFDKWLKINYYYIDREKNYKNILPRITAERFLEPLNGLFEYKIFCVKGKPIFIQYNFENENRRCSNIYDLNWVKIPVTYGYKANDDFEKPKSFELALEIAKKLSKPFEFVRVDLYNVDEKIIFSELTFHSGGGYLPFTPFSYDLQFGNAFAEEV
jgi:hypothetical protein